MTAGIMIVGIMTGAMGTEGVMELMGVMGQMGMEAQGVKVEETVKG